MHRSLYVATLGLLLASSLHAQILPGGHHINTNEVTAYQAQVRMQAMALTGRWAAAFAKDDTAHLAAMYTKDAVLLGADGAVARTRKLIGENLQRAVPRIGGVQMTVDDFDLSGEMVYIAGRFTYDLEQRGGGVLRQVGPFSMVLRRDFGTSDWQIRSHMTPGPLVDGSDDAAPMADIGPAVTTAPVSPVLSTDTTSAELLRRAGEHYERARAAQRAEDWTTYGAEMQKLGEVLRKVGHQS